MLLYGEAASTFGEPVELLSYQISENHSYKVKSFIGWGDTAGDFEVYLNNQIFSGCRTSNEKRTEQVWWGDAFVCNPYDEIIILGTHYAQGLKKLKCNLEIVRLS